MSSTKISSHSSRRIGVYVLELKDGNFYVGQSTRFKRRFQRHETGSGAQWTALHPIVRIAETDPQTYASDRDAAKRESELALHYMRLHGWQKVRGGAFCAVDQAEHLYQLQSAGHFREVPPLTRFDSRTGGELPGIQNFYAVAKGRTVGIFLQWDGPGGAKEAIDGYRGAIYKKFKLRHDAEVWFADQLAALVARAGLVRQDDADRS